jgi:hypothetical protein
VAHFGDNFFIALVNCIHDVGRPLFGALQRRLFRRPWSLMVSVRPRRPLLRYRYAAFQPLCLESNELDDRSVGENWPRRTWGSRSLHPNPIICWLRSSAPLCSCHTRRALRSLPPYRRDGSIASLAFRVEYRRSYDLPWDQRLAKNSLLVLNQMRNTLSLRGLDGYNGKRRARCFSCKFDFSCCWSLVLTLEDSTP